MKGLVIALLTYSRPCQSSKLAQKISKAISKFPSVELLVIENDSSNTINSSALAYPNCNYYLKTPNRGLDNSIIQAAAFAKYKKKYLWFLCDDDYLDYSNIDYIVTCLLNTSFDLTYIPWHGPDGRLQDINSPQDAYIRMSFLPTIACNPSNVSLLTLRSLIGTNYIHIGLLNLLLCSSDSMNILDIAAGTQKRNYTTRFPAFQTFVTGYYSALTYYQYLPDSRISRLLFTRTSSALSYFKNQHLDFRDFFKFLGFALQAKETPIVKKLKFIVKLFVVKCF